MLNEEIIVALHTVVWVHESSLSSYRSAFENEMATPGIDRWLHGDRTYTESLDVHSSRMDGYGSVTPRLSERIFINNQELKDLPDFSRLKEFL